MDDEHKGHDHGAADAGEARPVLSGVVEALCGAHDGLTWSREDWTDDRRLPSRDALLTLVEDLRSVLFPGYFGASDLSRESLRYHVGATLERVMQGLQEQVTRGICFLKCHDELVCRENGRCESCSRDALRISRAFLGRLPEVRRRLATDVQAAFEGDPALLTPDEAIFCYPGLHAVMSQRLAHELFLLEVPLIPRIITEHAHGDTGIDIHPGARIGDKFFIDHGTGVVIGETCIIGNNVRIYQGVTLGAKSFPLDDDGNPIKGIPRHPIVEDDVVIYSGATILGRITVGKGAVIGGNVWITDDVPPGGRIAQKA